MAEVVLTLDLGNSALKLVRWGTQPSFERVAWGVDWQASLRRALEPSGPELVTRVLLSSVVKASRLEEVVQLCETNERRVEPNPEVPLRIDCRESRTIGRDRLYAATAAWSEGRTSAIVVDAGTALTVDALGLDGGRGVFLGGAIAPGPELLARSLGGGTSDLYEVRAVVDAPALGRSTLEALTAGISVGFQGAARELVARVASEANLGDAPVWLTGGAASLLDVPGLFDRREVRLRAQLVHRGLLAAVGLGDAH